MGTNIPAIAQCFLGVPAQPCLTGNTWAGAAHFQHPQYSFREAQNKLG